MDRLNLPLLRARAFSCLTIAACICINAGCQSTAPHATSPLASPARVTTVDGIAIDPRDGLAGSLAVVVFISNDCPISNALAPELCALAKSARDRGISFYGVHANPPTDLALVVTHAKDYGFSDAMDVLLDPDQTLARATGAQVMPEAVLFRRSENRALEVLYIGRVNDLYSALGRRRASPTQNDLRDAIDAASNGVAPAQSRTKAIGCFIEMSPTAD